MWNWVECTEIFVFVEFEVLIWICGLYWKILREQKSSECGLFKRRKLRGTFLRIEGICRKRKTFEVKWIEKA